MKVPARVGFYYSAAGRERYLARYDEVARFGPPPSETLDVPTTFGAIRVYRHGPAIGAPIVLLPGGWATAASWAVNVEGLAAGQPVYSVDVLGQPGHSVQTLPVRTAEDCASWLSEVLATVARDQRAHLVGASYGGWLGLNQSLRVPERVASVTLVEPANTLARFSARFLLGALSQAPGVPRALTERFYRWVLGGSSQEQFLTVMPKLLVDGIRHFHPNVAIPGFPSDQVLRSLRVPMLALLGGRSVVHSVATAQRRALELVAGAEVHVWPRGTHALSFEFADEVNARILDFIGRNPAQAATS